MKTKAATSAEETIPNAMDKIVTDLIRVPPVARIMTNQCRYRLGSNGINLSL
jgi:hypothetical protein